MRRRIRRPTRDRDEQDTDERRTETSKHRPILTDGSDELL
jgi:hypothetical protein